MTRILLLTSSPRGENSLSTKVARQVADALATADTMASVAHRDLGGNPPPHIGEDFVIGMALPPEARSPAQQAAIALSDTLVAELLEADIVVIASSMINFGLSSSLKSWLDHVLRAGLTFAYTETGPQGLVTGKIAYLIEARGGIYSDGPMKPYDFQQPYLQATLGFIGITDIRPLLIEGVAFGPEAAANAVAQALAGIPALLQAA